MSPQFTAPNSMSRRVALVAGLAAASALAGSAAASAVAPLTPNDDKLVALGDTLAKILTDAAPALHPTHDPAGQNSRLSEADATLAGMAVVPSDTMAGVATKAHAYLAADGYDVQNGYEVGLSLARDVLRLKGGAQ